MRLLDLEPRFLRYVQGVAGPEHGQPQPDGSTKWGGFPVDQFQWVDSLAEADGIGFLCPACFGANGGAPGTHGLQIWFAGGNAPPHIGTNSEGQTVRWSVRGTGFADLITSPSILLQGPGCGWHGYIGAADGSRPGEVVTC